LEAHALGVEMKKPTDKESDEKINTSEDKSLEQELQQLWNTYSQSPIPTIIVRKDGKHIRCNEAATEMTGYTLEETPDMETFLQKAYPDKKYRDMVYKISKKSINDKIKIRRTEFTIVRKDGEQRHIAFSVYLITHSGKPTDYHIIQGEDITVRKQLEEDLRRSELELKRQKQALEQKNIALREVIAQIETERNTLKEDMRNNIITIIEPIFEKLIINNVPDEYIDLFRHLLENLSSSFGKNITRISDELTPREIEICSMIENGLMNKEIAKLLKVSPNTIRKHRENIRKKIGIQGENINLRSFLKHL